VEEGAKGYSQDDLDRAFTDRDEAWEEKVDVDNAFRATIEAIKGIVESTEEAKDLLSTRLRNQADFYSLFGAVQKLLSEGKMCDPAEAAGRLLRFTDEVESVDLRATRADLTGYFDAARSASNDKGPREARIRFMVDLLSV
jgi:hypothetical protein